MELVYLWVEKYKNIDHQGFNFSPRFTCKYENGTFTIGKNEPEPINIFPQNINVTAIVGENGSGKSSLLKLLHNQLVIWGGGAFAIFVNKENEKFYLGDVEKYSFLNDYKQLNSSDRLISFPLFEYSFTYDIDLHYSTEYIYPKKQVNTFKGIINLEKELLRNQKNILLNYFDLKKNDQLEKFESFFIPKTINIFFDTKAIKSNDRMPKLTNVAEKELEKLKTSITHNITTINFIEKIKLIKELLSNINSYEKLSNQFNYFSPIFEFELGMSDTQEEEVSNLWHSSFQSNNIDLNALSEIKTIQLIRTNEEWLDASDFHIYSFDIDELNPNIIEVITNSFSSYQFTIQLCDINKKALNDLSFGEQQLLFILNQLYSLKNNQIRVIENIGQGNEIETNKDTTSYIVLFDEIDIGLHPMWQKKSISYICDFLKLIPNINFHLIFSTHSPFILSDIPKDNVIFLKDGKQDNPDIQKTFGANIHTLLSHGFFMREGLMGEFAKNKINDIKIFYEEVQKSKTPKEEFGEKYNDKINDFKYIHSIIGEPFLKTIIKNYLDELEILFYGKKEFLDNEIKRLQDMQESLK